MPIKLLSSNIKKLFDIYNSDFSKLYSMSAKVHRFTIVLVFSFTLAMTNRCYYCQGFLVLLNFLRKLP